MSRFSVDFIFNGEKYRNVDVTCTPVPNGFDKYFVRLPFILSNGFSWINIHAVVDGSGKHKWSTYPTPGEPYENDELAKAIGKSIDEFLAESPDFFDD